jgi:hypothetical protein
MNKTDILVLCVLLPIGVFLMVTGLLIEGEPTEIGTSVSYDRPEGYTP